MKSDKVMVSVCCMAYNHEHYIRRCLEGFVMQKTNFKYEVLIHDDASTDRTADIIREYEEKYPDIIKPIYQTENQYSKGVAITKEIQLPRSKGKYIALCEGDDYWFDPLKLQKQFDVMESNSECSICVHRVKGCNEDGSINGFVFPEPKYELEESECISKDKMIIFLYERGGYPFQTSSYFFRREVLEVNLDYPRDVGILRKSIIVGKVFFLNEYMSVRRFFSIGSWSSKLEVAGKNGVIKLLLNDLNSEKNFNEFTNYIYNNIIINYCFLRILPISTVYGEVYLAKKLFKEYGIHLTDVKAKAKFSCRFHYWLIMNFTIMEKIYYILKCKLKRY